MDTTYIVPFAGLAAVMPQLTPPWLPGISIVSVNPGGVKSPWLTAFSTTFFQRARSAGLRI